ncbi:hypothetical protein C8N24_2820 [Solirubrobacter pauli]|uniref:Uncharacterized protein n=1 Tax=Solirubrobacter pauli TaxID=166793 RepID=A0A660LGK0_9ACTN|nr:hypothetical protein [Solirubrobacter pauli]RKQ92963.1 hypothetical protein C8N24_2820 [Solirubrobacter pauli]
MKRPLARLRGGITYANAMSTIAVFIALGGTTYAAVSLPRNSVGSAQIRSNAVGSSEIRSGSIRSSELHDGSVALRDISKGAQASLRGAQGPAGPAGPAGTPAVTYRVAVNSGGGTPAGNAKGVTHTGGNEYTVAFDRDVSACQYAVSLVAVQNGPTLEQPPAGRITAAPAAGGAVLVKTFAADGSAAEAPFHLLVAC